MEDFPRRAALSLCDISSCDMCGELAVAASELKELPVDDAFETSKVHEGDLFGVMDSNE